MSRRRTQPPTERVREEWERRVAAEYGSAALTHHLTLWLIQAGASPDLIREGLRIVDDELAHAELSHAVAARCGGGRFVLDRNRLGLARRCERLEEDILATCVASFCLGETVAVPLFRALREPCVVPLARRALDRILRDEVRHRDFGWALLGSLLDSPDGESLRAIAARDLPAHFANLRASYAPDLAEPTPATDDERAWGLMPAPLYREVLERTLERDFVPRFGEHRIDARQAWTAHDVSSDLPSR